MGKSSRRSKIVSSVTVMGQKCVWHVRRILARKKIELVEAEADSMAGRGNSRLQGLSDEIKKLMDLEECMWNQRSRLIG